jgi:hypothetical protein
MKNRLLSVAFVLAAVSTAFAQGGASVYTTRLSDARAVYLTGAVGDGQADDTAAIQAAIDAAQADRNEGIVGPARRRAPAARPSRCPSRPRAACRRTTRSPMPIPAPSTRR